MRSFLLFLSLTVLGFVFSDGEIGESLWADNIKDESARESYVPKQAAGLAMSKSETRTPSRWPEVPPALATRDDDIQSLVQVPHTSHFA